MSKFHEFIPKSYLYLRSGYSLSVFKKDMLPVLSKTSVYNLPVRRFLLKRHMTNVLNVIEFNNKYQEYAEKTNEKRGRLLEEVARAKTYKVLF